MAYQEKMPARDLSWTALIALAMASAVGCGQKNKSEVGAPPAPVPTAIAPPVPSGAVSVPSPRTVAPIASSISVMDKAAATQFVRGVGIPTEVPWSWTLGKSFEVDLGVPPDAKEKGGKLTMKFAVHAELLKDGKPVTVSGHIGAFNFREKSFSKAGLTEYVVDIPGSELNGDKIRIEYTLDRAFKSGNSELGVQLFTVALAPAI